MPKKKRKRKVKWFRVLLSIAMSLFIIAAIAGASVVYSYVKDAPQWDPSKLKNSETSIIYDTNGKEVAKIHGAENRIPVKFKDVPEVVKNAFLATEDVRFYEHGPIDFRSFARAVVANVTQGYGAQGFSSLTQQLAKNAFLTRQKTLKRKVQEIYLAFQLEHRYTKDEIFEMYLNRMFFGHNAWGIQAAAQTYFNKNVQDLNLSEAAMLAGLMKAPNTYSPFKNPEAAKQRRAHVLNNMAQYGFITQAEADKAAKDNFTSLNVNGATQNLSYPYQYFIEYVEEQLINKFGPEKVFEGGLRVYTTLDQNIQKDTETALNNPKNYPWAKTDKNGNLQPQAAAVIIDPHTGYIKAIVGGRGTDNQKRVLNRATQSKRQPGSSFKPLIAYGPAIERGLAPTSVVDDAPVKFGSWEPKNDDGSFRGLTSLREGIRRSVNIVAIKLVKDTGISKAVAFAKKAGIKSLPDVKNIGLGIALGDHEVTPLEMASAYSSIANGGIHLEPTTIIKVLDRDGTILEVVHPKQSIAMKPTTSYILGDIMQTVVQHGTGTSARMPGWAVAGKTGTTDRSKDTWFCGFTPKLVGVVWMGFDKPTAMPHQYGGKYPAQIWHEIMTEAHKDWKPISKFEQPNGIVYATVAKFSGKLPSPDTPTEDLVTDMFAKGTVPTDIDDSYVKVEVCTESNQLPNDYCPDKVVKTFLRKDASEVTMPEMEPTQVCTLHGPNTPQPLKVCVDPRHEGKLYLANIPGPNQTGGCPDEYVRTLPEGIEPPTEYCPLPEHKLVPKPETPDSPDSPSNTSVNSSKPPELVPPHKPKEPKPPVKPS